MKMETMTDVQAYTLDKAAEHSGLIEEHLIDFIRLRYGHKAQSQRDFCLECLWRHLHKLQGFSEEGVKFFPGDRLWGDMATWSKKIRGKLKTLTKAQAEEILTEARKFGKALVGIEMGGSCSVCEDAQEFLKTIGKSHIS